MTRRRRGLAVAELLVLVAIIGVLAAMLFPVFARARETARAATCMSNVVAITGAIRMYVAEWGRYWPSEHDPRVITYFNSAPGGGTPRTLPDICGHAVHANPYLREPVVLSRYVRDRNKWKCPNARLMSAARFIVPRGPGGDWLRGYLESEGAWGRGSSSNIGPCYAAFPSGWGGRVTDSFVQGLTFDYTSDWRKHLDVFLSGYSVNKRLRDLNPAAIAHPAWYIVMGDGGRQVEFWDGNGIAYPDLCKMVACGLCSGTVGCCNADWVNCEWSRGCGLDWSLYEQFFTQSTFRRQFTRHYGGSYLGFADGHAAFFPSEFIVNNTPPLGRRFEGTCLCWPTCVFWE